MRAIQIPIIARLYSQNKVFNNRSLLDERSLRKQLSITLSGSSILIVTPQPLMPCMHPTNKDRHLVPQDPNFTQDLQLLLPTPSTK